MTAARTEVCRLGTSVMEELKGNCFVLQHRCAHNIKNIAIVPWIFRRLQWFNKWSGNGIATKMISFQQESQPYIMGIRAGLYQLLKVPCCTSRWTNMEDGTDMQSHICPTQDSAASQPWLFEVQTAALKHKESRPASGINLCLIMECLLDYEGESARIANTGQHQQGDKANKQ